MSLIQPARMKLRKDTAIEGRRGKRLNQNMESFVMEKIPEGNTLHCRVSAKREHINYGVSRPPTDAICNTRAHSHYEHFDSHETAPCETSFGQSGDECSSACCVESVSTLAMVLSPRPGRQDFVDPIPHTPENEKEELAVDVVLGRCPRILGHTIHFMELQNEFWKSYSRVLFNFLCVCSFLCLLHYGRC